MELRGAMGSSQSRTFAQQMSLCRQQDPHWALTSTCTHTQCKSQPVGTVGFNFLVYFSVQVCTAGVRTWSRQQPSWQHVGAAAAGWHGHWSAWWPGGAEWGSDDFQGPTSWKPPESKHPGQGCSNKGSSKNFVNLAMANTYLPIPVISFQKVTLVNWLT